MAEKTRIPTSEMMRVTGLSRARLSELVSAGVIPKSERGFFPYPEAPAAYCSHLRESAAGRSDTGLSQARARLAMLQGDGHALENAVLRGEYLRAADVTMRWDTAAGLIRADLLAAASAIGSAIPHLSRHDIETIENILRAALTHAADEIDSLGDIGPKDDNKE